MTQDSGRWKLSLPVSGPMLVAATLAGTVLLGLATPTAAQERDRNTSGAGPFSVGVRAGYANASGDLGDVSDEGFLVGAGIAYRVLGRLSLNSELAVERLRRGGRPPLLGGVHGPRTDIWHILMGAELELTEEDAAPWSVWVMLTGGASYFDVSGSLDGGASIPPQADWKPTLAGGLVLGYDITRRLGVVGRSTLYNMFGDRDKEGQFLGNERTIGISIGLRFSIWGVRREGT